MTATHPVREDIDLLDGHWYANEPHDLWEWMRDNAPVYYDERRDVWGITRHADVLAIEKDPKTFSSKFSPRPHGQGLPMMISMDDPLHTRRRRLVYHGFTPKRVRDKEPTIRKLCTQIIDNVCERGECDFVWDIAAPLPLLLIADMLGFPPESYDDLLLWSDDLIKGTTGTPTEETMQKSGAAAMAFREFQLGVIADRRAKPPQDDLVSILCHAEIEGEKLDDESLVQETLLILIGGDETTRHVISTRDARADGQPRPARDPRRGRRRDDDHRRRGAAPVGHADQEHVAHGDARRGGRRTGPPRGRPADPALPVGQP